MILTMGKFMGYSVRQGFFSWLKSWFFAKKRPLSDIEQARRLLAAIDRGGIPLNPAKVNAIARDIGLEVSRKARVGETIQRLRDAVARAEG
ncbi:MAG: hypothetical protein Q8R51_05725 [Azonexus sp.]|nr:hypothetical protein [Azonexus sp.]